MHLGIRMLLFTLVGELKEPNLRFQHTYKTLHIFQRKKKGGAIVSLGLGYHARSELARFLVKQEHLILPDMTRMDKLNTNKMINAIAQCHKPLRRSAGPGGL
jgi:ABC-type phosphate/phosphonate transport system ATPase subunit